MQDLGRYTKRTHVTIKTQYLSFFAIGSVILVGLVFSLGVLMGSRQQSNDNTVCTNNDPLAALDTKSNEPAPPLATTPATLSFHESLAAMPKPVPTPASLLSKQTKETKMNQRSLDAIREGQSIRPNLEESAIPEKLKRDDPGYYSLQVGSFQKRYEAKQMVRMLERAGHNAFLVSVNMPSRGGRWYRVRVGPFLSKRDAYTYKKEFEKRERIPAFVVKRRVRG
ncbi:MAG: SPOR domain-containing protein [Proteobacteria bacterium]|nr:SPOR domain-containing protein [Pseudomonadota bacterium]